MDSSNCTRLACKSIDITHPKAAEVLFFAGLYTHAMRHADSPRTFLQPLSETCPILESVHGDIDGTRGVGRALPRPALRLRCIPVEFPLSTKYGPAHPHRPAKSSSWRRASNDIPTRAHADGEQ